MRTLTFVLTFLAAAPALASTTVEKVCKADRVSSPAAADRTIPRVRCRTAQAQVETTPQNRGG
jgi:hypothetical protein